MFVNYLRPLLQKSLEHDRKTMKRRKKTPGKMELASSYCLLFLVYMQVFALF